MNIALMLLAALVSVGAHAAWVWEAPLTVGAAPAGAFPHLESANRQGVAVSGGTVGVVWEDSRSGGPQCYLALKRTSDKAFADAQRVSESECYEAAVAPLEDGRFAVAWEEGGGVWARVMPGGTPLRLSSAAVQVTLAAEGKGLWAAWAEKAGKFHRIVVARLERRGDALRVATTRAVEAQAPADEQGWPALAARPDGRLVVAWEDRRHRHTVPMASTSTKAGTFGTPARLPDHGSGSVQGLGAGMGAMRPTLASIGANGWAAVWLDKRDFLSGYDVYAAFADQTGRFGRNVRVQDSFGDNVAQWHAKVVANARGQVVVVWDDARDGTPDVWMAESDGQTFGDNLAVPGASGPGAQAHPVAALDDTGALHLVWLDEDGAGRTQIRYARGVPQQAYRPARSSRGASVCGTGPVR